MAHEVIPTIGIVLHDRLNALESATIPDWIKQRIGKWTSSQMWKLFVEPRSKADVWSQTALTYIKQKAVEILTGEPTPDIEARAIEYGRQNEKEGYLWYAGCYNDGVNKGIDIKYYGIENPRFFPYGDNAGGSPDAEVGDDGLLEIKAPYNSSVHLEYMMLKSADELPREYTYQAQSNLLFTGRTWMDFASYNPRMIDPRHRMKVIRIYKDEAMQEAIKLKIAEASQVLISIIDSL